MAAQTSVIIQLFGRQLFLAAGKTESAVSKTAYGVWRVAWQHGNTNNYDSSRRSTLRNDISRRIWR